MIKIIKGTYGAIINGQIRPKNANSAPFTLDEKEEARLVKMGVAEYVGEAPAPAADEPKPAAKEPAKADEKEPDEADQENDLEKKSMKELAQIAKELNINSFGLKKAALIEKIKEAAAQQPADEEQPEADEEEDETVEDDTPAPTFNETGVV